MRAGAFELAASELGVGVGADRAARRWRSSLTARRAPLRPGRPRPSETPSANSSTPSSELSSSASSAPGVSSSMRSIGICTEPTSARSSTLRAGDAAAQRARRPWVRAARARPPPPRMRSVIGSIAAHGISSDIAEDEAVDLDLERDRQRRFADRRDALRRRPRCRPRRARARAAELVPGHRELADDRVEHAAA